MSLYGDPQQIPLEERLNDEQKKEMGSKTTELASSLHDEWRAPRKLEDGTFEPRVKATKDEEWVKAHGTDQVDIANSTYAELPKDWQGENKASAEVAMNLVYDASTMGRELDDEFVEEASSKIHDAWLERNGEWAPEEQKKPYLELSEEEKAKDRVIVQKAISIHKKVEGQETKPTDPDQWYRDEKTQRFSDERYHGQDEIDAHNEDMRKHSSKL